MSLADTLTPALPGTAAAEAHEVRAERLRRLLMAAVFADLSLIPMLHVGGLSIKFGLFAVALLGITRLLSPTPLRVARAFALLVAVVWIGSAWLFVQAGPGSISETARMTAIYGLAACGFAYGYRSRVASITPVTAVLAAYCAVTLALTFFWYRLPGLIAFYGLEPHVESNLFAARSPGIMYNPNVSGLALNVLLFALVLGWRYGIVTLRLTTVLVLYVVALVTQILLASRGEMLTTIAIGTVLLADLGLWRRRTVRAIGATLLLVVIAAVVLHVTVGPLTRFTVVTMTVERVVQPFTDTRHRAFLGERATYYTAVVWDRFWESPIWGTGFDGRPSYPYSQVTFHNDWYSVVTAGGLIGLALMVSLLRWPLRVSWVLIVPFFASGFTNAFVAAPLQFTLYWVTVGILLRAQRAGAA